MSGPLTATTAPERLWWLRTLLVLQAPRAVFAAVRDDSDEAAEARQEPLTLVVFLAGIAIVLGSSVAGRLYDDPVFDGPLIVLVWAIVGGAMYGLFGYFLLGALAYAGARPLGSLGSYRRARHVLGFAAAPVALSLLVWPVRLALHGGDAFRSGGSDEGTGDAVFDAVTAGFAVWAVVLLAIGTRTVHGWSWPRSLAAAALPAALPVFGILRALGLV